VGRAAKDPLGLVGPLVAIRGRGGARRAAGGAGARVAVAARLRSWSSSARLVRGGALTEPAFSDTVVDNHLLNVARMRQFPDEDVPLSALESSPPPLRAFPGSWRRR